MNTRFIIYRILGNSLPPRHGVEDAYRNLRFILEREAPLPGCEKRWLLNRFIDKANEDKCIELIRSHGQRYDVIPFDAAKFQNTFLDASGLPEVLNPYVKSNAPEADTHHPLVAEWIHRHRSQALININAARNRAIKLGRSDADWILPLDGSCFFTESGWKSFAETLAQTPDAHYGIIPMARITDNAQLDAPGWQPPLDEEPQIAFRRDAPDLFDETLRYGNRNKVELLIRLGVPGPWNKTAPAPWDNAPPQIAHARNRTLTAGWICRLATGAEAFFEESGNRRFAARIIGVERFSREVDAMFLARRLRVMAAEPLHLSPPGVEQKKRLASEAERLLANPFPRITDKTERAPSGNPQDYLSISRYVHIIDGKPVHIDGQSNPAAIIGSPESRRYDRTALYECLRGISILTAEDKLERRDDYLAKAVSILRHWFVDPSTRMNPHARFAQLDPRHPDQNNIAGLIDFRDLWILPTLCRHLLAAGALPQGDYDTVKEWAADLLKFLNQSQQGMAAASAPNNIGTWTHLLKTSLALFVDDRMQAVFLLSRGSLRFVAQHGVLGMQHAELARTRPLHYSLFNMTAWVLLANLSRAVGTDLWNFRGIDGQSLCRMMNFIQTNLTGFPEFAQSPRHFAGWLAALRHLTPDTAADRDLLGPLPDASLIEWQDNPDTGLPPQWPVFLLPSTVENEMTPGEKTPQT